MVNAIPELYSSLSHVLQYPDEEYRHATTRCVELVRQLHPDLESQMNTFAAIVKSMSMEQIEETYVHTFDVQSICCLDAGFALFGEDYKRGQFMAELKGMFDQTGVTLGSELPDYLPNILKLLTRLDFASSEQLVQLSVYPAVQKMIEGFGESQNFYRGLLCVVMDILKKDFIPNAD